MPAAFVLDSASLTLTGHDTGISIYYAAFVADTAELVVDGTPTSIAWQKNLEDSLGLEDTSGILLGVFIRDILTFSEELSTTSAFFSDLSDALALVETITLGCGASLESALTLEDSLSTIFAFIQEMLDTLELEIAQEDKSKFFEAFISSLLVSIAARERMGVFSTDSLGLDDSNEGILTFLQELADSLGFAHTSSEYAKFFQSFVDALSLSLSGTAGWGVSISDSLGFVDTLATLAKFFTSVSSALTVSDSLTNVFIIRTALSDSLALGEALETSALFNMLLEDSLILSGTLTIDGVDYIAWVLNPMLGRFTQYTNYPFNSFMPVGNNLFAFSEDGLYKLTGSDDNGTDINARFRSGLMDFGSSQAKNARFVALGASSSGEILLKVTTTRNSNRITDVYRLVPRNSGQMDRITKELSNARQAQYWEFEIENVDGASIEMEEIAWRVMILQPRIY